MRRYVAYSGRGNRIVGIIEAPCDMDACRLVVTMWDGHTQPPVRVENAPAGHVEIAADLDEHTRMLALYDTIMRDVNHLKGA